MKLRDFTPIWPLRWGWDHTWVFLWGVSVGALLMLLAVTLSPHWMRVP